VAAAAPAPLPKRFQLEAIRKLFEAYNPGVREPSDLADNIDPSMSLSENISNLEKIYPVYRWRRPPEEEVPTAQEIRERQRQEEAIERLYRRYLADIGAVPSA